MTGTTSPSDDARWLTNGVLLASKLVGVPDLLQLQGAKGAVYSVTEKEPIFQVRETAPSHVPHFKVYQCLLPDGSCGLLKISTEAKHNESLFEEAKALMDLRDRAHEVEAQNPNPKRPYNYDVFVPDLVESFISEKQKGRRINILDISAVANLDDEDAKLEDKLVTPLCYIWERDRQRVDPKTAAWMVGKSLKIVGFAQDMGLANGDVSAANFLFTKRWHNLMLLNWTRVQRFNEVIPPMTSRREIQNIGRMGIKLMGGDPTTGAIPAYPDEMDPEDLPTDDSFYAFIRQIARGDFTNGTDTCSCFYHDVVEPMWGRKFHSFTTFDL